MGRESTSISERFSGLHIQLWRVERLLPYVRNARTHTEEQVAQVAASILEFGWTNPILVGGDGVIIAGHARLAAARKLKMAEVPVIVFDHLAPTQHRALVLADNKLALNAGWDDETLRVELAALEEENFDLDLVGFSTDELEDLLRDPECARDGLTDEDAVPDEPEQAITKPGDLWLLGEHRLLCGDAIKMPDVEKVMDGGLADMAWTDPPYNVDYEGKTARKLKIGNDALGGKFYEFLRDASANMLAVTKGSIYMCMSSSELHTLHAAFAIRHRLRLVEASTARCDSPFRYSFSMTGYSCEARTRGRGYSAPLMARRSGLIRASLLALTGIS